MLTLIFIYYFLCCFNDDDDATSLPLPLPLLYFISSTRIVHLCLAHIHTHVVCLDYFGLLNQPQQQQQQQQHEQQQRQPLAVFELLINFIAFALL